MVQNITEKKNLYFLFEPTKYLPSPLTILIVARVIDEILLSPKTARLKGFLYIKTDTWCSLLTTKQQHSKWLFFKTFFSYFFFQFIIILCISYLFIIYYLNFISTLPMTIPHLHIMICILSVILYTLHTPSTTFIPEKKSFFAFVFFFFRPYTAKFAKCSKHIRSIPCRIFHAFIACTRE